MPCLGGDPYPAKAGCAAMDVFPFLRALPEEVVLEGRRLHDLPPSSQALFAAICDNGPLSHADLRNLTALPARTIRFGLRRLRDAGFIDSRPSLRDSRVCYFFIRPELVDPAALQRRREQAQASHAVVLDAGNLILRP